MNRKVCANLACNPNIKRFLCHNVNLSLSPTATVFIRSCEDNFDFHTFPSSHALL